MAIYTEQQRLAIIAFGTKLKLLAQLDTGEIEDESTLLTLAGFTGIADSEIVEEIATGESRTPETYDEDVHVQWKANLLREIQTRAKTDDIVATDPNTIQLRRLDMVLGSIPTFPEYAGLIYKRIGKITLHPRKNRPDDAANLTKMPLVSHANSALEFIKTMPRLKFILTSETDLADYTGSRAFILNLQSLNVCVADDLARFTPTDLINIMPEFSFEIRELAAKYPELFKKDA